MEDRNDGPKYTQLGNKDTFRDSEELTEVDNIPHSPARNTRCRYFLLITLATTLLVTLSITQIIVTINFRRSHSENNSRLLGPEWPCGTSASEARARGCHFDYGLVSWIPHECYNEELDNSFRSRLPFEFYVSNEDDTGPDFSRPINNIGALEEWVPQGSWTTMPFHEAHCLHAWQYMHQALLKGRMLPRSLAKWTHTLHCTGVSLNDTRNIMWSEISPTAQNRYPMCVRGDGVFENEN